MLLDPLRSFSRDVDKLGDPRLRKRLRALLLFIEEAKDVRDIPNIKKVKGHPHAYRIRLGDHRLGVFISDDVVQLVRFLHRREVYRWFP